MLQFSGVISYMLAFKKRKRSTRIYIKDGLNGYIVIAAGNERGAHGSISEMD